jgi:hypothetical protein
MDGGHGSGTSQVCSPLLMHLNHMTNGLPEKATFSLSLSCIGIASISPAQHTLFLNDHASSDLPSSSPVRNNHPHKSNGHDQDLRVRQLSTLHPSADPHLPGLLVETHL